ncbi:MAG TPA: hypothetical protein VF552_03560 [Allosphingosinicella sp.]|jgi:hypothetical protein
MSPDTQEPVERARRPVSLAEISRVLEETARLIRQHAGPGDDRKPCVPRADLISAPLVRSIIATRRMRRDYFPTIGGDPAWSMMLELFAAGLEGRRVSQTMLGTVAGVAESTALRLTKTLIRGGSFTADRDPDDRRLVMLGLSEDAAARMNAYLTAAIVAGPYTA